MTQEGDGQVHGGNMHMSMVSRMQGNVHILWGLPHASFSDVMTAWLGMWDLISAFWSRWLKPLAGARNDLNPDHKSNQVHDSQSIGGSLSWPAPDLTPSWLAE